MNCRACGRFTPVAKAGRRKGESLLHCNVKCYGIAQRGKSRADRTSPSRKVYIQVRDEAGKREYLHRKVYRESKGIDEIPEGMVVHHRNENPRINEPENLEARPRNEHTPNAHFHWKTRDYETGEPLPEYTGEFEAFGW